MQKNTLENLTLIVHQKMIEYHISSDSDRIFLSPHHNILLEGKQYTHSIITRNPSGKKFFLKILKENDSSLHCNHYLKQFKDMTGEYLYPIIVVPVFEYNNIQYYITTYIKGQTLDDIPTTLFHDKSNSISKNLLMRIDELSLIHSSRYSEKNKFVISEYNTILKPKIVNRLRHPLFEKYCRTQLEKAYGHCCKILDTSQFSEPTLIHMDIKPANIICDVTTGLVTLIDFEFARFGDKDYGWTQLLLSGINSFRQEYKDLIIPHLTKDRLTLEKCIGIPKYQCYILYQTACNLVYYADRDIPCPKEMEYLFLYMLKILSKE